MNTVIQCTHDKFQKSQTEARPKAQQCIENKNEGLDIILDYFIKLKLGGWVHF